MKAGVLGSGKVGSGSWELSVDSTRPSDGRDGSAKVGALLGLSRMFLPGLPGSSACLLHALLHPLTNSTEDLPASSHQEPREIESKPI